MEKVFLSDVLKAIKKAYIWNDEISQQILEKEIKQLPPADDVPENIRCKDCKWFNDIGCSIFIADDSDRPTENDFCSFAERRTDERLNQ